MWPQPLPSAHGSAPSMSQSDAVPRHFCPARKGTVVRLKQSFLPPTVVVATSERLLRCCLPQDTNTVPYRYPRSEDVLWLRKGPWGCAATTPTPARAQLRARSPKHWGKRPIPKPCLCLEAGGVVTAMQHPTLLFSRLPVVLRYWLHLGLPYLETKGATLGCVCSPRWACRGFFGGSDLNFEEKQMMFCNCCRRAAPLPASVIVS